MVIEPTLQWEQDLWPVFDRLKAAMDRQESARLAGQLDELNATAGQLFRFLETLTFQVWLYDKVKTEYVYLAWKNSRGINAWVPDRDLVWRWFLAEVVPCPVPTAEAVAAIKARHQAWKDKDKANEKLVKAEYRRIERERKKQEKKEKEKIK